MPATVRLQEIGRHFSTGAALPAELAAKASAAKHTFSAVDIHTQLFYSLLDQMLHSGVTLGSPSTSVLARAHADHHCLAYHAHMAWHHRFSHLVGYGARYYSYLSARAVAAQIWRQGIIE